MPQELRPEDRPPNGLHPSMLSPPNVCPCCKHTEWDDHTPHNEPIYRCRGCGYNLRHLEHPSLAIPASALLCIRCEAPMPTGTPAYNRLCIPCRNEIGINPDDDPPLGHDQLFPLCKTHGSLSPKTRALVDILLPIYFNERWTNVEFARAAGIGESEASRILRFYSRYQVQRWTSQGEAHKVIALSKRQSEDAYAARGRALALSHRVLTLAETVATEVEAGVAEMLDDGASPGKIATDENGKPAKVQPLDRALKQIASLQSICGAAWKHIEAASGQKARLDLEMKEAARKNAPSPAHTAPSGNHTQTRPKVRVIDVSSRPVP